MKHMLQGLLAVVLVLMGTLSFAQTNPAAQTLPYTQNFGTTTFTAMPTGMAAWGFSGATATTQTAAEGSAPSVNATIGAATALQTGGQVWGYMTATNARPYVQTSGNATNGACQLVLAINTTSLTNITVAYDVEIISAQPRTVGVVMQYRVGTTGAWTTVTGTGNPYSQAAGTTGVKASPSIVLPAGANGQSVVQIRWATWRGTEGGNSSGIAIDNINVTGTAASTPNLSVSALTAFGGVCTGTDLTNSFTITGTNLTTAAVEVDALAGYTFSTDNVTFTDSLDITQGGGSFSQLVYVKFSPTLVQSYNGNIPVNGGGAPNVNVVASGSGILSAAPALGTNTTTAITSSSATLGNNITAINCSNATVRGIEWSTTQGFANGSGTQVTQTGSFGTGAYTVNVTGLPSSSIIYYKAFATNATGTTYSAESSFLTYLNITDLTIIAMNTSTPDNFAFVSWVDMPVGTKIKFTDNAFNAALASTAASNARGGENFVVWNNTTASAIPAGTVITITDGVGASVGSVVLTLNGLAGSGEQIFAYQGPGAGTSAGTSDWGTGAAGNHTFSGSILYGINLQGSGTSGSATWLSTGAADANKSYLPAELNVANANNSFGGNALGAQYIGPRTGQSSFAGYKTLIHNAAYWNRVTTGSVVVNTTNFILSAGGATQIAVTAVNGGVNPTSNSPFAISIETRDAGNVGAFVSQNTDVLVSVFTGTGALLGTTTGTIPAGQSILTISGLTYNIAETGVVLQVSTTSGDILLAGQSAAFNVLQGASQIAFTNVSNWAFTGTVVPFFNVEARRPDNTVDNTYTGSVTINMISGTGAVVGTLTKSFVAGVALFNDIIFDTPGVKQLEANGGVLGTALSATFTISTASLTENILPQFMEGNQPSNTNRIPYACFLTIGGLQPNTTYFYSNQVVIASDAATNAGAGNPIFVSGSGFTRTTTPSFSTPGAYGTFTTNGLGTYAGWYVLEPTANTTRFAPGTDVFMRIALNNGAGGTFTALRLTTTSSIRVMSLGTAASNGTALRGNSAATAMNFIVAYDNVNGTGRPISGTFVESDGVANTTAIDYASFYSTSVNGVAGAYGMIIPNTLPNGIRRIEQRFRTSGAITSCPATDADGIWPSGANTVNPNTGTTAKVITATDAPFDPLCVPVIPGNNDNFVNATFSNSNGSIYPNSRCFNGDLTGASISPEGNSANVLPGAGQDRWYMAVAASSAFRITANSTTVDLVIEMRMYDGTEVNVENAVLGPGQEIMFVTGLTPGATYFFGARSYDGTTGAFTLCISSIMDGNCGTNTALPLDNCTPFKTTYTGAANYTVTFTPVTPSTGGGSITTVGPFSLGTASLNLYPGNTYTVSVTANYTGFVNGAGTPEGTISLTDPTPCTLVMANHANIQVRTTQRCAAPATLLPSTILRTDPFVCGVSNYTFRFTPAADCAGTVNGLPFEFTSVSRNIPLNFPGTATVPSGNTIQSQTFYIVEVRPNFGAGGAVAGTYGSPQVIFIGGTAMTDEQNTSPSFEANVQATQAMSIFPNPGNGQHVLIDYQLDTEDQVNIVLRDAMGRIVHASSAVWVQQGTAEIVFDERLAKGLYLIEVSSATQRHTMRWIVE